ncbi:protein NRT1/ PTR FAMILY 1.2-like [Rutidosis leptorrhynchoides]|uniref:protein NRT1/ PTR FAMILY 1.2-like n=1 Tax=Rutidosis leptorrhynchoides TaxID=125765 RepID=UPI003A9A1EF4
MKKRASHAQKKIAVWLKKQYAGRAKIEISNRKRTEHNRADDWPELVGCGGIKSSLLAFGVDQFDSTDNSERASLSLDKYISRYYQVMLISNFVGLSGVVYVQERFGWKLGFGISIILLFFAVLSFFAASPLYVMLKAKKRPFCRFLNKSCIISNAKQDFSLDKNVLEPSRVCTVDQVEELKALIKVAPILSTSFIFYSAISQSSIEVVLVKTMERHLTPNFEIPAGFFTSLPLLFSIIWLALYDHLIIPLASKILGRPVSISIKTRLGIGLLSPSLAMALAAVVESLRRKAAIQEGFADKLLAVVNISASWLLPKFLLSGIGNAFIMIGLAEFFLKELPKSMSSVASVIPTIGVGMGPLLLTFIFSMIDYVTGKGGKDSWVSTNVNKAHFDYFFWLLSILSLINFVYFLICCKAYGPCIGDQDVKDRDEEKAIKH